MHPRTYTIALGVAVALISAPSVAAAQTCLGFPSFGLNHMQMGTNLSFGETYKTMNATLTGGSHSAFGTLSVGGRRDDANANSTTIGGVLGYQVRANARGSAQICPTISARYGQGTLNTADETHREFAVGLSLGRELFMGETFRLVPAVMVNYSNFNQSLGAPFPASPEDINEAQVGLALGMVFDNQLAIRLSSSRNMLDEARRNPTFGVSIAVNFGGRR